MAFLSEYSFNTADQTIKDLVGGHGESALLSEFSSLIILKKDCLTLNMLNLVESLES